LAKGAALGSAAFLVAGCLQAVHEVESRTRSIEVMYAFSGSVEEGFREEVGIWAQDNDVKVTFSQTDSFNELIATRAQGNDSPDVALFPQPTLFRQLAERGLLRDLGNVIGQADLDAMIPDLGDAGQVSGDVFSVPVSVDVKSIVFYEKTAAEEAGLAPPPASLEDLQALTDRMVDSGVTPWCFGVASDEETGWPATDWVESLLLTNYGAEIYNQWVAHEIPFNDPRVADVLDQMETLLLQEGTTHGGRESSATTNSVTAVRPMFDDPPGCRMYRQGSFVAREGGVLQDVGADTASRIGVFPMPGLTPEERPVLGGGQLAGVFAQADEAAEELVQFLASSRFGTHGYAASGTWISPRTDFDRALYPNETWRAIADIAHASTEFVFDGSEQMPREVSRSFGLEMTAWISGEQDIQTTLDDVEHAWPT
jgi:alpha-glucoside transport system substrate-binding protein